MTSREIRQSFLDFFKSKGHTIVPSSSLLPDSPNLLFTNAGMNQFVPIFLGQQKAPFDPPRAADTQKCIRAGGKQNDLEDVGFDTYHHTFFEMLGNWSFGDYFKKEAIEWAWALVTEVWKFPKERLYATVYNPDRSIGDPSEFDQEAFDHWARLFAAAGLDPKTHIVYGGKKDNFWMMGETGPCGPCSELHVDLTAEGNTAGALVNKGSPECIEIWNLVFIQFNANPDGSFTPLPASHVDTGMGLERVASIIQGTKQFSDFKNARISNYETDVFRPIFDKLEELSGKTYASTLPGASRSPTVTPPPAVPPGGTAFFRRRLMRFARPWPKYMVTMSTHQGRQLSEGARDIVLKQLRLGHEQGRYELFAACVLPTQVHFLLEVRVKEQDPEGKPVYWPLSELLNSIKTFTADEINKLENQSGQVWEDESFDRLITLEGDFEERFQYIQRNPWDSGAIPPEQDYRWVWVAESPLSVFGTGDTERIELRPAVQASSPTERAGRPPQVQTDIAFRVIADHIRTLSFAIADGIKPSNTDRGYVLRRILRRAARYGRALGFHEPFLYKLVDAVAETMCHVFPEIIVGKETIQKTIEGEEKAFNKTLDKGLAVFEQRLKVQPDIDEIIKQVHESSLIRLTREDLKNLPDAFEAASPTLKRISDRLRKHLLGTVTSDGALLKMFSIAGESLTGQDISLFQQMFAFKAQTKRLADGEASPEEYNRFAMEAEKYLLQFEKALVEARLSVAPDVIPGSFAFVLYDTYGFPLDLTELMARELGLTVDVAGFSKLMEEQRARGRAGQKKTVIELSQIDISTPTNFLGYEKLGTTAKVLEVLVVKDKVAVVVDGSTAYAEAGGQVGDTGALSHGDKMWRIVDTQKVKDTWLHFLAEKDGPSVGSYVDVTVDPERRYAVARHHTVTHLLHWALHKVVSHEAAQKGSYVGPDKLTFDFNSGALTPAQLRDIERLVNERIIEGARVSWTELPYAQIKSRADVMQFFGEKYSDHVRVVQIGGEPGKLDGYSMELCGGTHTTNTSQIGLFRILAESAIGTGLRRIEAVAGLRAYDKVRQEAELLGSLAAKVNSPVSELEKKIEAILVQQKDLERQLKALQQRQAAETARALGGKGVTLGTIPAIIENLGGADGDFLQAVADALKGEFKGVIVFGGVAAGAVSLVAAVSPEFTAKIQAGKLLQTIAPIVGGKGGGRPDNARGGGRDANRLNEALTKASEILKTLG